MKKEMPHSVSLALLLSELKSNSKEISLSLLYHSYCLFGILFEVEWHWLRV